jgi:hypothetical protein
MPNMENRKKERKKKKKKSLTVNDFFFFWQKWSELAQQVKTVLKEYPKLRLTQGRKVTTGS